MGLAFFAYLRRGLLRHYAAATPLETQSSPSDTLAYYGWIISNCAPPSPWPGAAAGFSVCNLAAAPRSPADREHPPSPPSRWLRGIADRIAVLLPKPAAHRSLPARPAIACG